MMLSTGIDRTWFRYKINKQLFPFSVPESVQVFFVMRKKNSQVSTLHVIHHGCMPMSVWFGVKFTPGKYQLWLSCIHIDGWAQRVSGADFTIFFPYFPHSGGHSTFFGLLNTFVHIVMYSYYLFSALGPRFQKYLWWKKYLTALQMVSWEFEKERDHVALSQRKKIIGKL